MPIPANVARVVLSGRVSGGEDFSTGFWVSGAGSADALLTDVMKHVTTFWQSFTDDMYTSQVLTKVSVYHYAAGGSQASGQAEQAVNIPGTRATPGSPLSTSVVVTTLTGAPGRSNRGRMYLPFVGLMGLDGRLADPTAAQRMAQAVAAFLGAIRGDGDGFTPVVVSTTHTAAKTITSVRADDVPDSQRRRDESLVASQVYNVALPSS